MSTLESRLIGESAREVRVSSMPMWRKRELAAAALRALVLHRKGSLRRLPLIHRHVGIREANGRVTLGHLCEIHDRVVLSAVAKPDQPPAALTIGDLTSIWYGTVISARHEIVIGRECAISWNCSILDNDMHRVVERGDTVRGADRSPRVHIGDHVWIGASSVVLKGVTIGANAVVAAGSLVTNDVPANTLVAGAPAKVIREIDGWR